MRQPVGFRIGLFGACVAFSRHGLQTAESLDDPFHISSPPSSLQLLPAGATLAGWDYPPPGRLSIFLKLLAGATELLISIRARSLPTRTDTRRDARDRQNVAGGRRASGRQPKLSRLWSAVFQRVRESSMRRRSLRRGVTAFTRRTEYTT